MGAGQPRKQSLISREGIRTSTVVRGKGEGGGRKIDTGTNIIEGNQERLRYFCPGKL